MKEVKLKIDHVDHTKVVLRLENGTTFTFDPTTRNGEELIDFLES